MTTTCQFSNNTSVYLGQFQRILSEMIRNMTSVTMTDSISGSFITQMIPHHRAAIEMSGNLLKYTVNVPLQNIALNIIASQQKSIENMTKAYPICRYCINSSTEIACYKKENDAILNTMFCEMKSACSDNSIDADFMREMIPHHRGAVRMSENALRYPLCPELVPLLEAIIISQKEGIRQMQQLLRQIGC
ncbi:MAG: DUF305 domain-containing protein [Clostridium sp.]|nr:DUF305 domain-containing protein [Clostridium sp.]